MKRYDVVPERRSWASEVYEKAKPLRGTVYERIFLGRPAMKVFLALAGALPGRLTVGQLVESTHLPRSTVLRWLKRLIEDDLVRLSPPVFSGSELLATTLQEGES